MQAYKFNTRISDGGIISLSLPYKPELFNTEVEVIVLSKTKEKSKKQEEKYTAKDFLREWTGILKDMSDEELENARYEYLMEKHG